MITTISQRELRNDNGRIMRELENGNAFIVTRNGQQIGELTPLRKPRFVRSEVLVEMFQGIPRISYEELRADLDAVLDQDMMPRA